MATEIADAYIALYATMPGVKRDIEKQLDASGVADSAGRQAGSGFSAAFAGAIGGAFAAITSKAMNMVASSIDGAIARVDTMNAFPKIMQNFGYSAEDASASINKISDGLKGLPTTVDSLAGMVQQLAPLTGSLDEATTLSLAFNNALLAGGKSTDLQKNAMEQYTQMLSVGTVDLAAWRSMVAAMPGQMNQLAQSMLGASAGQNDLYEALKNGAISFDEFNAAVIDLNENGTGAFASFQDQAIAATDGIATSQANLETAITRGLATIIDILAPTITAALAGVTDVTSGFFSWFGGALQGVIDLLVNGDFTSAFAQAFNVGEDAPIVDALLKIRDGAMSLVDWFTGTGWPMLQDAFNGIMGAIGGVIGFIVDNWDWISTLAVGVLALVAAIKVWVVVSTIVTAAQWAMTVAMNANPIGIIIVAVAALVAALVWFFTQTELGQQIWQGFVDFLGAAWNWLWESVLKPVFDFIGAAFTWLWEVIIKPIVDFIVFYFQVWGAVFTWLYENVVKPIFEAIAAVFSWIYDFIITPIIFGVMLYFKLWEIALTWLYENVVKPVFDGIAAVFTWIYDFIITPIVNGVIAYINLWAMIFTWLYENVVKPTFESIGAVFTWLYENIIKPVWEGIQAAIQIVADWFTNTLWPGIETTLGNIGRGFEVMKDAIAKAWENIQNAAKEPVRFIVETVYNDGIRATFNQIADAVGLSSDVRLPQASLPAGFASGGVLPGYTPGRDVHKFYSPTAGWLHLSGGEGIIRPDALRALGGKAWLDAVNASRGQAFADGGVWDAIGGTFAGATDWLSSVASSVASIISDPLGALDKMLLDPVKNLLAGMGGGSFGQMLAEAPLKLIEGIKAWFSSMLAPTTGGVNGNWVGGNTLQRLLPYIAASGTFITDTYRDPAYNAAVGGSPTSYHMDAANPAVDVAGSNAAMWAFYRMVVADPGGWRQLLWQVAGHFDHVHVASGGGVFGDLPTRQYDAGGYIEPGLTLAYNGTGRPEPVFTAGQWEKLERLANGGMPSELVVRDVDGVLIGRMRVESADIAVKALEHAGIG